MECGLCDGMRICGCGRDWHEERRAQFAAMAMQGFLSGVISHPDHNGEIPPKKDLCKSSVEFADALINALQEPAAEKS